jgi:predicted outer membrane repeat protein
VVVASGSVPAKAGEWTITFDVPEAMPFLSLRGSTIQGLRDGRTSDLGSGAPLILVRGARSVSVDDCTFSDLDLPGPVLLVDSPVAYELHVTSLTCTNVHLLYYTASTTPTTPVLPEHYPSCGACLHLGGTLSGVSSILSSQFYLTSAWCGGSVFVNSLGAGSLELRSTDVSWSLSGSNGGALFVGSNGTACHNASALLLENASFAYNQAAGDGGAIFYAGESIGCMGTTFCVPPD